MCTCAHSYSHSLTQSSLGAKAIYVLCWSPQMPSCQISWAECFIHGGVHRSGPELMHYSLYTMFSFEPCSDYHTPYHCCLLHQHRWACWGWAELSRNWVSEYQRTIRWLCAWILTNCNLCWAFLVTTLVVMVQESSYEPAGKCVGNV